MSEATDDDITLLEVTKVFRLGIFKTKTAVKDLTLSVPRGKIIGLLGPNGSGKSTTLKMILGFLRPSAGTILLCGQRVEARAARAFIGYLPENPRFQKFLQANEILAYYGKLFGMSGRELGKRADELLDLVGLTKAAGERVQGFSKGMTQRLAIAQALLNRPRLLIFDEPMSGLDPLGRMEIRRLIARVHEEMPESTIFFSTHILGDVEAICSDVALLKEGRLSTFCPIESLLAVEEQRFDLIVRGLSDPMQERYARDLKAKPTPLGLVISLNGPDELLSKLTELRQSGAMIVGLSSQRRNLEETLFGEGTLVPPTGERPSQSVQAGGSK